MTPRMLAIALLAAIALVATAAPATAADPAPLADYWSGFIKHWSGMFQKQNGIVMFALGLGVVCLFIITRGKWRK